MTRAPIPGGWPATALAVGLLACLALAPDRARAKDEPAAKPEHVVLVVLGGGVRSADVADPELMPALANLAGHGRLLTGIESDAPDGYAAAARILTGRDDGPDGTSRAPPEAPTLCEYVRGALELPREKVWYVSHAGGDDLHLAHSTNERYGSALGPGVAHGFGAFAEPLRGFLEKLGRPVPMEPEAWEPLRRLRLSSRAAVSVWLPSEVDAGLPRAEAVERALLRELDRKALLLEGPNPRDEQAFRAARTVIEIHRPVLTVVRLGEAEQAQTSFERYRAVLRANDAGIRRLRAAVAGDPRMAGRTTFVVVGDRGRNEKPDESGALGADDDSRSRRHVAMVIAGPGLARKRARKQPRHLRDVCPTVARLLGVEADAATGRVWAEILAPP
jgi:hypothetical protein